MNVFRLNCNFALIIANQFLFKSLLNYFEVDLSSSFLLYRNAFAGFENVRNIGNKPSLPGYIGVSLVSVSDS